jgi:hypothetical protein
MPTVLSAPPQILLTPTVLQGLQQQAVQNSALWQGFKARLDSNLNVLIAENIGSYQGEQLTWISDYALGYQILKDSDPLTAANYADKAIGLMKSGLDDYQKGSWVTRQFLARGDGTTRTFTLPNADLMPSTLNVYLAPVVTDRVVHSVLNGQDTVDFYLSYLKVSNTPDGPANYAQGTDWSHNANYENNLIDWSTAAKQPALGAAYYVTAASGETANATTAYSLNGNTITFTQVPSRGQAVFVEYLYGTHSADGSTLAYQQTSAGDGGFNSIFIDDTYTARYLGKHLAMGLDWLDGYVGLSQSFEQQVADMLVRWYDFTRDNGYLVNAPESNYGGADYGTAAMIALALDPRTPDGPGILNEVLNYRTTYIVPMLTSSTNSIAGGFWAEGWHYGHNAIQALLLGSQALEAAGAIDGAVERQWVDQVIDELASAQSAPGLVYDGGEAYVYPFHFLDKDLFYTLAAVADQPAEKSYANYILQQFPDSAFQNPGEVFDYRDLLFHDPGANASYWSALPLQDFASGTGLLTARSDWGNDPTWVAVQIGNLLGQDTDHLVDHQTYSPGQVEINRGADQLLINANGVENGYGNHSDPPFSVSKFANLVAINDQSGDGMQRTPFSMGVWYGSPGVVDNAYEATAAYTYLHGDYHAAYSPDTSPGSGGPASELTRQVVYVRPGYVFVFDRATTTKASFAKQLRWHFAKAPTVNGNTFVETIDGSRLFGATFSTVPLTTSLSSYVVGSGNQSFRVDRVSTQNSMPAASVRYATVFQVGTASTTKMDTSQHIVSTDARMEGIQIGTQVVLFGRNGDVSPATSFTYQFNGIAGVQHFLTNLSPGEIYQVESGGTVLAVATASSQGTLGFTTPAGTSRVTVHGNLALVLAGLTLVEGQNNNVTVASFTDANPRADSSTYVATITWGDGGTAQATVAAGTIVANGQGGFNIVGSHSYAGEMQVKFQVQVTDGGQAPDSASATINVVPLVLNVVPPAPSEGQPLSQVLVATFTDPDTSGNAASYTGRVVWGDGQTSSTAARNVVIQPDANQAGLFDVLATKPSAYAEGGNYPKFSVAVTEAGGASVLQMVPVAVADPALALTVIAPTLLEGLPVSRVLVATIKDDDTSAVASEYTAVVLWGDGESSASAAHNVAIQRDPTNPAVFDVIATKPHPFAEEATGLSMSVAVSDRGGASANQSGNINVGDAPLTLVLRPQAPVEGVAVASANPGVLIATLQDADPAGAAGDYTAGVTWGDGESSSAVVQADPKGKGLFDVFANKPDPYAEEARSLTFTVTVTDQGGATIGRSAAVNVADAALALKVAPPSFVRGDPSITTSQVVVATFTDSGFAGSTSDYSATVSWGDGASNVSSTANGLVTIAPDPNRPGVLNIRASKPQAYAKAGSYTFKVTLMDQGGSIASQSLTVVVKPA